LEALGDERKRREEKEGDERRRREAAEDGERRRWEEDRQRLVLLTERLEEEVNRRKEVEARLTSLKAQREKEAGMGMRMKDLGKWNISYILKLK
jgi:hypothetical protein